MVRRDGLPAGLPHEPPDPARARGGRGAHGVPRLVRELPPGPAPLRRARTSSWASHRPTARPSCCSAGGCRIWSASPRRSRPRPPGCSRRAAGWTGCSSATRPASAIATRSSAGTWRSTCSSCRGLASCATCCSASWCSPWPARRSSTCCRGARPGRPPAGPSPRSAWRAATSRCWRRRSCCCSAAGTWLDAFSLLVSPAGIIQGATYADVTAQLPALRLLGVAAAVGAVLAVTQAFTRRRWLALGGFLLYGATLGRGPHLRHGVPAPGRHAERAGERGAVHRAQHRGHAQGVSPWTTSRSASCRATRCSRRRTSTANAATIGNVRLWDQQPLLDTFGQIQEIRTYYDFTSVDVDRYVIDGQYRQVMLSARELNSESLPSKSWINEHLTFTHGYGLTLGPVNEVTAGGPAGPVHQEPAAGVVGRPGGDGAVDLLRRALERSRVRRHQGARVPLPAGRRQRVQELRRARRRPARLDPAPADVREPVPVVQGAAERGPERREPGDLQPPDRRPRDHDRAVPVLRPRPVPRHRRRPALLDPGRLHPDRAVPVLDADGRRRSTTSGTR